MKRTLILLLITISAIHIHADNSPYITTVYEYLPAPGQFVNILPEYSTNDDAATLATKAGQYIIGVANGSTVSLGSWGGYIIVGFDHTIVNQTSQYDFRIYGNAFSGSAEPGIVMVSKDDNQNGIPDDTWYELAGSEYHSTDTKHNYQVTYYRPAADKTPTPDNDYVYLTDTTYILWKDNQGNSGYVEKNTFHAQNYYPNWIQEDSITFSGARLANNAIDESGQGTYYVLSAYDWGYADNQPNTTDLSKFNIDWAVDQDGNPVSLTGIDFIKIYTAVLQMNGWIGECSTEVSGIEDLHPEAQLANINNNNQTTNITLTQHNNNINLSLQTTAQITLLLPTGQILQHINLAPGTHAINLPTHGIYLLRVQTNSEQQTFKLIQ